MIRLLPIARPQRRVIVACRGFAAATWRRQPWHTANGLAAGLAALGHEVTLLTDDPGPQPAVPYEIEQVPRLDGAALRQASAALSVERIFLVIGLLALARMAPFRLGAPVSLVLASPRLRLRDFLALPVGALWRERSLLLLPLVNALLPGTLLRRGWRRSRADDIVYLSAGNRARLTRLGLPAGSFLQPQADPAAIPPPPLAEGPFTLGYLGPPLAARGALLALEGFEQAVARGLDGRLLLLLRSDADERCLAHLRARVEASPAHRLVTVTAGMQTPAALALLEAPCHAFILPFVTPVSEVPLVVIEGCLSGRPVIVLDAPGVGEVARALGGIVAPSPAALPDAILAAARQPRAAPPDPAAWTRWDRAVARLLARDEAAGLAHRRLVGLAGVDGSGKSFLVAALREGLAERGIATRHLWSRFRNYSSKPLLALARLTGHNRKERHGAVRLGYHDFAGTPWLAWPYLLLQVLDLALDLAGRYRGRRLILADRCLYDSLVDLAVDTGLDEVVLGRLGRWLVRRLPHPHAVAVLERPVALIRADRPDALLDRNFARRRALYRRLARDFDLPILVNDGPPEQVLGALLRLLAAEPHAPEAVP